MNKRTWRARLMLLALLFTLAAASASAENAAPAGAASGLSWSVSGEGELRLSGNGEIPAAALRREEDGLGGQDFWYEAPWHAFRASVRSVTIGEGITAVGDHAFDGFLNLESVSLPQGLTRIGEAAFRRTGLTELSLPATVLSVGAQAFSGCWRLEEADLGESLEEIGPYAFYMDGALRALHLPGTLRRAGETAFGGCAQVEKIVFQKVNDASEWAGIRFENAEANPMAAGGKAVLYDGEAPLTVLRLAADAAPVGDYAFYRCQNELTVEAAEGYVGSIGSYAFAQCEGLQSARFGRGVSEVGAYAFSGCSALTDTGDLLAGSSRLMPGAFSGCVSLTEVRLGGGTEAVGTDLFSGCTSLAAVTLEEGFPVISDRMFLGCRQLQEIRIPTGTVIIGEEAFRLCDSLKSAVISDSVTLIGTNAFQGCSSLSDISFLGRAPAIGQGAFGLVRADVTCFDGPSWEGRQGNYGGFLTWASVSGGSPDHLLRWSIDDGQRLVFSGSGAVTATGGWYTYRGMFKEIVLDQGVTGISYNFVTAYLPEDGRVTFHAGVKDPVDQDMAGVSPERLAGVYDFTVLEDWTEGAYWSLSRDGALTVGGNGPIPDFGDAAPWKKVLSKASALTIAPGVTAIGPNAFRGARFSGAVELPDTVREIGTGAFADCGSLRWMILPSSVETIGENAFPAALEAVYAPEGAYAARWAEENGLSVYDAAMPDRLVLLRAEAVLAVEGQLNLEECFRVEPSFRQTAHQIEYEVTGDALLEGSVLTASQPGEVRVKAFLDGQETEGTLTVLVRVPVQSVTLPKEVILTAGEALPLSAAWEPQDAAPFLSWSVSDPDALILEDDTLRTKPGTEGEFTLTASSWNGASAQMKLRVYVPQVQSVAFRKVEAPVYAVGGVLPLTCEVRDQLRTQENREVVFTSSHPELISVDQGGTVSFLQSGSAVITASAENGVSDSVTLTCAVPAERFTVQGPDVIAVGQTPAQLSLASPVPENAGLSVTWEVSDPRIAALDGSLLRPLRAGEVTVTARNWDGTSAEKTVRVFGRVTAIDIAPVPDMLGLGTEVRLEVSAHSGDEPADPALLTYVSSDESVAWVNEDGLVSLVGNGDAVVTASAGTAEASVTFRVRQAVENFALPDSLILMQYHALELPVTDLIPENAWPEFTSAADEPEVLLIDEEGILIGRAPGETYLNVTSWNGVSRSVRVVVLPFEAENELTLPSITKTVRSHSFTGASFEAVTIPAGCRDIGAYAFADCRNLVCLFLPDTVRDIDETAFTGCDALVCVIAPKGSYAEKWARQRQLLVFND